MDKTVKMRAFDGKEAPQEEQEEKPKSKPTSGLAIKNPALDEERARSQEYLKKIELLENNLKEEKVKSATLVDALKKISSMATAATQIRESAPHGKDETSRLKDTLPLGRDGQ
jgi:ABC-type molybdate transport system substrate-binding protein